MISQVAVSTGKYCSTGVAADAVLSVRKPPVIAGIAGTGAHCQADSYGRPTWLVFEWVSSVASLELTTTSLASHVASFRALIYHEILHALGFSNTMFNNARGSDGARKSLIKLAKVTDTDGATDEVWHFTSGRAYEMGAKYFDCQNGSDWSGVPLMGLPESGRASHWETRVLRDDVMSYGDRAIVSSLTLAAMEDLGFYRADYSKAGCMSWGYKQGCAFVTSRCGVGQSDRSAAPQSSAECGGDPIWGQQPDSYLTAKCAGGSAPCDTLLSSGFSTAGGTIRCNAQCYTSTAARTDCTAAPSTAVDASEPATMLGFSFDSSYLQYVALALWILVGLTCLAFCRASFCPKEGSVCYVAAMTMALFLLGVGLGGSGAYFYWWDASLVESYIGATTTISAMAIGTVLGLLTLLTFYGACCRSTRALLFAWQLYALLLLFQIALTVMVCYWIHSLDDVTNDSLQTLRGSGGGMHSDAFGAIALAEAEAFTCRAYQTCCRDPALDAINSTEQTCLDAHAGTSTDVTVAFEDVSSPNFCAYVSGGRFNIQPASGVCDLIDVALDDFSLPVCRRDFCLLGIDGYFDFVRRVVELLRQYGYAIGTALAAWTLFQLTLIVNLWNLRRRYRRRQHAVQPKAEATAVASVDAASEPPGAHCKPPPLRPAPHSKWDVKEAWSSEAKLAAK